MITLHLGAVLTDTRRHSNPTRCHQRMAHTHIMRRMVTWNEVPLPVSRRVGASGAHLIRSRGHGCRGSALSHTAPRTTTQHNKATTNGERNAVNKRPHGKMAKHGVLALQMQSARPSRSAFSAAWVLRQWRVTCQVRATGRCHACNKAVINKTGDTAHDEHTLGSYDIKKESHLGSRRQKHTACAALAATIFRLVSGGTTPAQSAFGCMGLRGPGARRRGSRTRRPGCGIADGLYAAAFVSSR